jgi:hypothetical protein
MVLPLIGSVLAPALLGGTGFLAGTGLGFLGTGAGLAGLGAGIGSLAQGDDLETALGTGLTSGLTAGVAGKLLGGAGGASPTGLPEGATPIQGADVSAVLDPTKAGAEALASRPTNIIGLDLADDTIASQLNKAGTAFSPEAIGAVKGSSVAMSNLMPGAVGGLTAQAMQPLDPITTSDDRITYKPGVSPKDRGTPIGGDLVTGRERDFGFELPKAQEGMLKLAEGGGLKALPSPDENPGIRKLPEGVRNKMGYMQEGGITSMVEGGAPDAGKNDKEIITGAVRAIAGISERPQEDLALFVSKFGEGALEDLVDRVQSGQFGANLMTDGEGLQRGAGDGMDDMIPASIEGEQDVLLSNDEFVVPADVVSGIGNGSSDAGAKALYNMMDRVRTARTGMAEQPPDVPQEEMLPV